jgi:hypothetical protein
MRVDDLMGEKVETEDMTDAQLEELAAEYRRVLAGPSYLMPEGPMIYRMNLADIEEEQYLRVQAREEDRQEMADDDERLGL